MLNLKHLEVLVDSEIQETGLDLTLPDKCHSIDTSRNGRNLRSLKILKWREGEQM